MSSDQEILVLTVSLILSAFFSGSEAALMSLPHEKAKQIGDEHGLDSWAMKHWLAKPNDLLTTILVGNNVVNILIASLSTSIAQRFFDNDGLAISVGITTVVILLFGEIAPKTVGRGKAEKIAPFCVMILMGFYFMLYPVVKAFMKVIQWVLGEKAYLRSRSVTRDDIEVMVEMAEEGRSIDSKQIDLLNSILEFPSIKVKDIMVPRTSIEAFRRDNSFADIIQLVREVAHSRYPVYIEDLDQVLGFLHVKDLAFVDDEERRNFDVTKYLKPPFFVYEHMKIQAVFDHMNRKKVHLALVKDENGIVVGMLTLEDIMEEIFGEIQDEHDDEEDGVPGVESEEGVMVPSKISLRDLWNEFEIKIPLNDNYSTLNGFLMEQLGNSFPKKGHMIIWDGYSFELLKVKNYEIREVKIKSVNGDQYLREPDSQVSSTDKKEKENEHQKSMTAK
jgi:CBS domain containing-hemolysin-like protein